MKLRWLDDDIPPPSPDMRGVCGVCWRDVLPGSTSCAKCGSVFAGSMVVAFPRIEYAPKPNGIIRDLSALEDEP